MKSLLVIILTHSLIFDDTNCVLGKISVSHKKKDADMKFDTGFFDEEGNWKDYVKGYTDKDGVWHEPTMLHHDFKKRLIWSCLIIGCFLLFRIIRMYGSYI